MLNELSDIVTPRKLPDKLVRDREEVKGVSEFPLQKE
jgi:hypothetical protein